MPELDDDMRMTWDRVALALLAVAVATPAAAQVAAPSVERAPGNVELPEVEARDPLVLQLAYTGDILSSVSGGRAAWYPLDQQCQCDRHRRSRHAGERPAHDRFAPRLLQ